MKCSYLLLSPDVCISREFCATCVYTPSAEATSQPDKSGTDRFDSKLTKKNKYERQPAMKQVREKHALVSQLHGKAVVVM